MHWTPGDLRRVISYEQLAFHILKRKNQCKLWRLEKENLLPKCVHKPILVMLEKLAFGGDISGFGTTATKTHMENMDEKLYWDILQHQLKCSMAQMSRKSNFLYLNKT